MKILPIAAISFAVALGGCATQGQPQTSSASNDLQQQLDQAQSQQSKLQSENASLQQQLAANQQAAATPTQSPGNGIDLVPPNAKPGECFARVLTPAKFETKSQRVVRSAASERIVTTPAKFEWTTQRILVQPESTKVVAVPATYRTVSSREQVSPAHTMWKRGRGANERVDAATGEIMCLVTVPATYRTVTSQVVDQAATTKTVTIPAEYKTVRVRKLVQAANSSTIAIPATYQTITHTEQVSDPKLVWTRVVCETNATPDLIRKVQVALKKSGHTPGPIDGVLGSQTLHGARSYEKANGLAVSRSGVITYETMKSLGVATP